MGHIKRTDYRFVRVWQDLNLWSRNMQPSVLGAEARVGLY